MSRTLLPLLALALASVGVGQESRGTIAGRVIDPQQSVIPGAVVIVTNADTGAVSRTATNSTGYFEINLLNPGSYAVAVEAAGFNKLVRSGLELNIAGRLELELALKVGAVAETIEVTEAAPLLDTTTAAGGRVIDRREIQELPYGDSNPFLMASLAPGMMFTGNPKDTKPYDNGALSSFNTSGGVGQNEYTIDGAPVTGTGRRVGFAPPSDAVEEFKIETTTFDAAYGHTTGATINVMTRTGTNAFHGNLSEMHSQQRWNATWHFDRLAFEDQVRRGVKKSTDQKQGSGRTNNFGGSLGGPVRVPGLFDGRNKAFFFINYSGIYVRASAGTLATVPGMAWRQGDFSDLLAVDASRYTVYDPRSARRSGTQVVRTPFPGNKGIPILNPMAKPYIAFYPEPNNPPALVTADGYNNYNLPLTPGGEDYNALVNRYDYNLSEKHRLFGRWFRNRRYSSCCDWSYAAVPGLHVNGLVRQSKGIGGGYLWTASSSTILDLGLNWSSFSEGNERAVQTSYKPSELGLPSYLDTKAGAYTQVPVVTFTGLTRISASYPMITGRGNTGEAKVGLNSIHGSHSLKAGWQERRYWFGSSGPGNSAGGFTFGNTFMRAADNTTTAAVHGLEWASFLMGIPTSMAIDTNDSGTWSTRYRALYFQDDWRVSGRLRLMFGIRYEREGGITERFNRAIAGGFLYDAKLPITDGAQAAYAANPLPELPASQFKVLGGTEYLSPSHRTYSDGTHKMLPRVSAVVQVNPKTVVRAGYGWYYDTFNVNNTRPNQYGYSQPTSTTISSDLGMSFCCGVGAAENIGAGRMPVTDPFPVRADGTRFDAPYRDSLGLSAFTGRGLTFTARDFSPAFQQRWRLSVQRELAKNMVVDVSYNGAWAKIPVDQRIDYLPKQYWATGTVRDTALDNELNRNVTNPFSIANFAALRTSNPVVYSYLSTQGFFTSSTIRKHQLLRAYPQANGLRGVRPGFSFADTRGGNRYHDMQIQFQRRLTAGLQTEAMYTYAFGEVQDVYFNEFDAAPSWRPSADARPHRLVWSAIYEMPFGKGKKWLSNGFARYIAGDWQASWIYQYQSGPPTSWNNLFYYGDVASIGSALKHDQTHSNDIHLWFDPSIAYRGTGAIPSGFTGFEGRAANQPGAFQVRMFPVMLDTLRADGIRNWDVRILRRFPIRERFGVSVSADLLNITNHTNFAAPVTGATSTNFGRVTAQNGAPRRIQLNLRIEF